MQIIANPKDLIEQFHARVEIFLRNIVNPPQQLERFNHRDIPPELRPLAENHADRATYCRRWRYGINPFTIASPEVGTRMPVSILMLVDFPAPFGPI